MGGGGSKHTQPLLGGQLVGMKGDGGEPMSLGTAAHSPAREWDAEFQDALEMIDDNQMLKGYSALASLSRDFHDSVRRTMEIIISELALIEDSKTFLPTHTDFLFTMYDVQNVVYRVAHGGQGSESWKELGNELRHNLNMYRCRTPGICIPLMCLMDYKGFRTLAYAKLPHVERMVLGWDPILKGFISEMAELHKGLSSCAKALNLKQHRIGIGELAVSTYLNADAVCFTPKPMHNRPSFRQHKQKRAYITHLANLFPTDLTRGGMYNPEDVHVDVHVDSPFKLRPELIRRNAIPICPDVGLAPPKPKQPGMYVHEASEPSLIDARRLSRNMLKFVTYEAIEGVTRILKGMPAEKSPENQALRIKAMCSQMHAEGLNMRLLGHFRWHISPDTHDETQQDMRRLLLTEMVARVVKVSFHKVLREANGFKDINTKISDIIKAQLFGDSDAVRDTDLPPMDTDYMEPSDEACRVAIVKFLNVVFSRPYEIPEPLPIRRTLMDSGMDANRVEEVMSLTKLISEMKAYNRKHYPTGVDSAVVELKKEMLVIVRSALPGGERRIEAMLNRNIQREAQREHDKKEKEARDIELANLMLKEPLASDPFSVYWRETMRGLILRKFGKRALLDDEMDPLWMVLDVVDPKAVLMRVMHMTGIKISDDGFRRLENLRDKPTTPGQAIKWVETDVTHIGPRTKDLGVLLASKGWELMYKARTLEDGPSKLQILGMAQDCFLELLQASPNDWIACYDYGSSLYEAAWSGPTYERYDKLRQAYRHLRHSHKISPSFLKAMLRLGDCVYSMSTMRQDSSIEEDYVQLCVAAADLLDMSPDYANRCGVWADQVYTAAGLSGGYRSQRLYTLAGVTYNEWIGLGTSQETANLAWIIQHHKELRMEPADIGAMVELIRNTSKRGGAGEIKGLYYSNSGVTDACLRLTSTRVPQGILTSVDTSNLTNITAEALLGVMEEHGEWVETLQIATNERINTTDVIKAISLCYAEGFGRLRELHLDGLAGLRDESLVTLAPRLSTTLVSLSLRDNIMLQGTGISEVARLHPGLLDLDISGCERVKDSNVRLVVHYCWVLERFNVKLCANVTDQTIMEIAYRTRRHFKGTPGEASEPLLNHDDPMLFLVDLVLKNNGKLKKQVPDDDEDDDWTFSEGVGTSDDPDAMAAFEDEQRRRAKVQALKQGEADQELSVAAARAGFKGGGKSFMHGVDLQQLAIRLGLEDPAQREKRLRAAEKAQDQKKEEEEKMLIWELLEKGKSAAQVSRELGIDLRKCVQQKEKYDLQHRVFDSFMAVQQDELHRYTLIINIKETKIKKKFLTDFNPASRMFVRVGLTSGGTVKNSGYKPIMAEVNFQLNTFLPRVQDLFSFLRVDLMEKPDTGPAKAHAYYKAPMPKYIDYPADYKQCPLFGMSGFHRGQPVGKLSLSVRALGPELFEEWKEQLATYDPKEGAKKDLNQMRENTEKALVVLDKVFERVLEWAVTQMVDSFVRYKSFTELNVAYCSSLTDFPIIECVRSMPDIVVLDLSGVIKLTDKALMFITKLCPKMHTFRLDGCLKITDDGMVNVASGCLSLHTVSINECRNLSDATISFLINFDVDHRLRELSFQGLPKTTEESFSQIANACTSLTKLNVCGSDLYRDVQLLHLSSRCRQLVHLDIAWCEKLSDLGIVHLAKGCTRLEMLSLAYCEGVGTKGMIAIAENCPCITSLDMTGLAKVHDSAMQAIVRSLLHLSTLSISLCAMLTKETLASINDWGEGLTSLEMLGCSSMNRTDVVRFKEKMAGRLHVTDEKDDEYSAFDNLYK